LGIFCDDLYGSWFLVRLSFVDYLLHGGSIWVCCRFCWVLWFVETLPSCWHYQWLCGVGWCNGYLDLLCCFSLIILELPCGWSVLYALVFYVKPCWCDTEPFVGISGWISVVIVTCVLISVGLLVSGVV